MNLLILFFSALTVAQASSPTHHPMKVVSGDEAQRMFQEAVSNKAVAVENLSGICTESVLRIAISDQQQCFDRGENFASTARGTRYKCFVADPTAEPISKFKASRFERLNACGGDGIEKLDLDDGPFAPN